MTTSAQELFAEARELPPAGREAFLAQACGDNAELHLEVQRLLVDAERADSFFGDADGATLGAEEFKDTYAEEEGDVIGRYKLRQQIGEGGFGTVWMAEQMEPVSRRVALKIIKLGMDTREVIARFEAERQALAMMDHPNIAKVLDAGATDNGPAVLRHGTGEGHPDHRNTATRPGSARASGWRSSATCARRSITRTRRASSTATSSRPTSWSPSTATSRW